MKKIEYTNLEKIHAGGILDAINGACAGVAGVSLLVMAGAITVATGGAGAAILAGAAGFCFGTTVTQGVT